ncbi:Hemolysin-type calcium-binding region protein (fragment) [Agrobacterium deltaense Zutra 3/1]|uniref:Hemolysin-type calcium-binding region protein n=1 Tax=Agrobacterium deltaense Zutra 3/1 TaxID=1183427 RepID=A0A1S7PT58_9HYPH
MPTIIGTSAADRLIGTNEADLIYGLEGDDILIGGSGFDRLIGGPGADQLIGGDGGAEADYSESAAAININLVATKTGTGMGGDAQGDTLTGIHKIIGSVFNDTLTGNAGFTFEGGAGDDVYIVPLSTVIIEEENGGNDEIRTTYNSYSIIVKNNIERLTYIGTGNAHLIGNALDNVITGGSGNDQLDGADGADHFIGGAGTDSVSYATSPVGITLNFKTGIHSGYAAGDTFDGIEMFVGSTHANTFISGSEASTFNGGDGGGTVDYSGSPEAVNINLVGTKMGTGTGGDAEGDKYYRIYKIIGSAFNDTMTGDTGVSFEGGAGDDIYIVPLSAAIIEAAGGGNDEIRTTSSNYSILLKDNIERLTYIGTGNAHLIGNALDNVITGGSGNDQLYGYAGNDILIGNGGADLLDGGEGFDAVSYINSNAGVTVNLTSNTLSGGHAVGDVLRGIENLLGSQHADILTGSSANNHLEGYAGNDILDGKDGNDTLIGGAGADVLNGGDGFDTISYATAGTGVVINFHSGTFTGDAAGDTFNSIESFVGSKFADTFYSTSAGDNFDGGNGIDTVNYTNSLSAITINLLTGINVGGDASRDVLTSIERIVGSAFDDHMTSSRSGQFLQGGGGDDTYVVNTTLVTVTEAVNSGADTVRTSLSSYTLANNIEVLTFIGSGNFNGTGNSIDNTLNGGSGNDTLRGGAGKDILNGGAGIDLASYSDSTAGVTVNMADGNHTGDAAGDFFSSIEGVQGSSHADTFICGSGPFQFFGGAGNDTYIVESTDIAAIEFANNGIDLVQTSLTDYRLGAHVENLVYTGNASFTGTGNESDNVIIGGDLNDVLNGRGGMDTFFGGAGSDTFIFNNIADSSSQVGDLIQDFSSSQNDRIDLTALYLSTFIGTDSFSSKAGELRFETAENVATLLGDIDGDSVADFYIRLAGVASITESDLLI